MTYTRKNWEDNVSDLTAAELNRMEQGIYDNSLVVDAIKDKLNPTDTETYKTSELTEGQITDVIGVSDIVIKGQTSQDGEPTPSSPIDINVVSGSNVINTSNKNLFIPTLKADNTSIFVNNATVSLIKDEYTFIASGSDMYFGQVANTGATYSNTNGMKIHKNGNTKLSFLVTNTTFNRAHITAYNSQGVSLGYTAFDGISGTYTFPENCEFATIRIGKNNAVSGTTYKTKVMVVYGDTIPTTYEQHQGKELPLDLPVENLLNVNEFTSVASARIVSNATSGQTVNGIVAKPGTYTASFNVKQLARSNHRMQLIASSDSTQTQSGSDITNRLNTVTVDAYQLKRYSISITIEQECYLYLRCVDTECVLNEIQLEEGSKANAYTPYGTEPIELCKIGDYQDYFYKSGSKWYLHKEIGKDVIDENNTIAIINTGTSNWYYKITPKKIAPTASQTNQICNYYPNREIFNGNTNQGILKISNGEEIRIRYGTEDTVANFKTWLASNNIILYSLLATATDTEITNTTLISQLEAIYNAPLYEQTNITQENNDLPMVLDITACKDNINGIKAFIRK